MSKKGCPVKRIYLVIIIAVLIAVAAIVSALRHKHLPKGMLRISGTIEATTVAASFRIPGRLKERLVDEGAMVRAGQTIATLEIDDLERELRQHQANLQTAQAATAELQAGTRSEEIAQARAAVSRLQAEAERVTSDLTRQEGLFRNEIIATRDIEAARAAQSAAQAALLETKERLQQLQNGPRPETMRQARSRVDSAAATLSLAQNRLEHAILQAPTSGVVLAKHLEPGEQAAAGTPVITIGNMDEVWVRGFIPETELGKIKLGQSAQVTTDTFKGKVYPGTISFIAQEAEFTPKNVQTEKERVKLVYRIKITLKNPNHELKPGMPVDAAIQAMLPETGPAR